MPGAPGPCRGFSRQDSGAQKKKKKEQFEYGYRFFHLAKRVEKVPLPPFDNEEAGLYYPQPSTESVEQVRSRVGENFYKTMKATTGSHITTWVFDVDFAVVAEFMYVVRHRVTPCGVRIEGPSLEDLGVFCDTDLLTKVHDGQDMIKCVVVPTSVRMVYSFKTFRLTAKFRFTRSRLERSGWVMLDDTSHDVVESVVQVSLDGVIVTDRTDEGGILIDSKTSLDSLRVLLELALIDGFQEARFFLRDGRVRICDRWSTSYNNTVAGCMFQPFYFRF